VKPPSIAPRPLGGSPLGARPAAPAAPKPAAPGAAAAAAAAATATALGVPKSASASASPPAAPPGLEAAPAAEAEGFDPATVPIERCAAITAELRHRRSERAAVLAAHKFSEAEWAAIEGHWSEAIAGQTFRGDRKLLAAYDVAYVAAQEKLGLRVGLADHARLQVASERGTTAEVLAELGLEPSDQMRLGRVWTQRLVGDPKRMAELAAALEAARKA
jgi:predicted nucleic acid-binding protein